MLTVIIYYILRTVSKGAWFILLVFVAYVIVENIVVAIKNKNPKHLLELVWYFAVGIIICGLCWKQILAICQRVESPPTGGWWSSDGKIADMTTGRSSLWLEYMEHIFSSVQVALFGSGIKSGSITLEFHAHNIFIEYLYKFGFVGVGLMLAIIIVGLIPYIRKIKIFNLIAVGLICGIYFANGSISMKYIYIFASIILLLAFNYYDNNSNNINKLEN